MPIKAVSYARFSTSIQREESIEAQERAIMKYASENGYEIVAFYRDRARSGTNADRDEFQKMIRDSKDKEFSAVIVHKLDRFSRDRLDYLIYKRELAVNGVALVSTVERIDDSP